MRPTDPRLVRRLAPARRPLAGVISGGVVTSFLVIGQAWLVAGLVVAVVDHRAVLPWALAVAAVFAARGLVGFLTEVFAARAAGLVGTDVRREVLRAVLSPSDGEEPQAGETAVLMTRGVAAAEPYLTRYLPALVLASVLPLLTVVVIATQDVMSAVIVLATLPLIPVFGALVGLATRDRAEQQWRAMASLSGYFLDVMRGSAHARRLPPRRGTDLPDPRGDRALPQGQPGHPAHRLRELGRARAGRDPLGRAGRRHGRREARGRPPRPPHRPDRAAAGARGVLAAASCRCRVPRRRRGRRDLRAGRRAPLAAHRRPPARCRRRVVT